MPEAANGIGIWGKYEAKDIPGSTRIPISEIKACFPNTELLSGIDIGSGNGRSTDELIRALGCKVTAIDLSRNGVFATKESNNKVIGDAQFLPFINDTFDFANLAGLMANLAHINVDKAKKMRTTVASETYRCLRQGGYAFISDFVTTGELSGLQHNYRGHALVTGEYGTSVGFKPPCPTDFEDMSDEEILEYARTHTIDRFTHHYAPSELIEIFSQAGFVIPKYSIELGQSPSGRKRDVIILTAQKPNREN